MGIEPWYRWPINAFKSFLAGVSWNIFCWATGYKGFVCDFATMDPLPCELWWQEVDAQKEGGSDV